MKRIMKKIAAFFIILTIGLVINNKVYDMSYKHEELQTKLTQDELKDIKEAKRLKEVYGDRLFNSFSKADIPIIAFNNKYEFLINNSSLDNSFKELDKNNSVVGDNIYIRENNQPQAFAVKVGSKWCGSMSTLYTFNYDLLKAMKKEMPFGLSILIPHQFMIVKKDIIPSAIIHEMVHGYFGNLNEIKLNKAEELHKILNTYPYTDNALKDAWNKEGKALYSAMNANSDEETIEYIREFLDIRDKRREEYKLSSQLIDVERFIEWEEGLGKYSEIKIYEFAANENSSISDYKYKTSMPYWKADFKNLRSKLGTRTGDYRFYLSGMAQAMILDKLSINWKGDIYRDGVYLEDKLRELAQKKN